MNRNTTAVCVFFISLRTWYIVFWSIMSSPGSGVTSWMNPEQRSVPENTPPQLKHPLEAIHLHLTITPASKVSKDWKTGMSLYPAAKQGRVTLMRLGGGNTFSSLEINNTETELFKDDWNHNKQRAASLLQAPISGSTVHIHLLVFMWREKV